MSRFLSDRFAALTPYVPGEQPRDQRYIKLNTNESPYPPAIGVLEAVSRAEVSRLNLYSDPTARELESAIAAFYGVNAEQVMATNGSDEALAFCFQAFCDQKTGACFPDITYGFYEVFARLYGVPAKVIPLDEQFRVTPALYRGAGGTIFLANPNAPTGIALPLAAVEEIARQNPNTLLVVDEAYVDFGGESAVPLIGRYDNVLVVMTCSKSRNLAGGRVGFVLGSADVIRDLRKIKYSFNPYNLNRLSLLAGAAALRDEAYFRACVNTIMETRAWAARALGERGFEVLDSRTNFVFAKPVRLGGKAYYEGLKAAGVLVRHFDAPRVRDFVRISIGTPEEMRALLDATDRLWEEKRA
ncbi:MAG: histidinol-phosphate transaminase [Firmicutes bacterium]|nr:histidinol-phosphate transaminase [Bacillota bacterium]